MVVGNPDVFSIMFDVVETYISKGKLERMIEKLSMFEQQIQEDR